MNKLENYKEIIDFQELRHDPSFHLGLGDVRLTFAMQQELEREIFRLKEKESALNVWLNNLEYDPEAEGDDCATCQLYKTIKAIK